MVETLETLGFQVLQHFLLVEKRLNHKTRGSIRRRHASAVVAFQRIVQLLAVAFWIVALDGPHSALQFLLLLE